MHNVAAACADVAPAQEPGQPPTVLLFEAVARQMCVYAMYNRQRILLAPHILYTRHGDLFIDAVTYERDGQRPREIKFGTFKFAGMSAIALTDREFEPSTLFQPDDEKYAGETVFAIECPKLS